MAARNVVRFVKSVKVSFSTFDQRATGAWCVPVLCAEWWWFGA